jgi:hypothetical protein
LDAAPLKAATVDKEPVILTFDEHSSYIRKRIKKDPTDFRPDILHQVSSKESSYYF